MTKGLAMALVYISALIGSVIYRILDKDSWIAYVIYVGIILIVYTLVTLFCIP